jgi:TolB-like protein
VLKTCAAYLVVGFGVLEGADLALPRLGVGDGVLTVLVVGVVVGFPLVAVVSWFYDLGAGGLVRTPDGEAGAAGLPVRMALMVVGVAAVALLAAAGWGVLERQGPGSGGAIALADDRVAIPPFRVSGDPSLAYLGEGMLDLLAAKLTGEGGLRAVDPRTQLARWRSVETGSEDDARSIARGLGAGRLLMGSVVGSPASLQMAARVLDTRSGDILASHEVSGAADTLSALVDRFAGGLLTQLAEVDPDRLRSLDRTPLPALRAYLDGHRLLRAGRFEEARDQFGLAQRVDSTFPLPGIFHAIAASFTARWDQSGAALAWRHRESLSPRDQLLLRGVLNEGVGGWTEREALLERITEDSRDRVEAWYLLADAVYHDDLSAPAPERLARAAGLFRAASALDDRFGPANMHRFEIALLQGDQQAARSLGRSVADEAGEGDLADYVGWFMDHLGGRPPPAPADGDRFATMRMYGATMSVEFTLGLAYADAVVEWGVRNASEADHLMLDQAALYMWNRGRPDRAWAIVRDRHLGSSLPTEPVLIYTDLYWEAGVPEDSLARAAEVLIRRGREARERGEPWVTFACVAGQYLASRGRIDQAPALETGTDDTPVQRYGRACRAAQAILAARAGEDPFEGPDSAGGPPPEGLAESVAELDRLLAEAGIPEDWLRDAAPLLLAWGYERTGDAERALPAIRRRRVATPGTHFFSSYLREEGRLAARLGRTDEARRAWSHYLAVRSGGEPEAVSRVQDVRARLEASAGR